jgi:hypothetical protein
MTPYYPKTYVLYDLDIFFILISYTASVYENKKG